MYNSVNIGIIACDLRQLFMANMLADKGYNVYLAYSDKSDDDKPFKDMLCELVYNSSSNNIRFTDNLLDLIKATNILVAPVPLSKISEFMSLHRFLTILSSIENKKDFVLFAGMIDSDSVKILHDSSIHFIDYMKSDKLTIFNTIATAEGIIAEAIIGKNTNLHGSMTLVLGYGKCGKTLSNKLYGMSAKVCVAARNDNSLKAAYSLGYDTLKLDNLSEQISKYEYIFNTIPALILDESILKNTKNDALILDIASAPGGVDKNAAMKYGIKVCHSLGIPGRFSPKSSGEAIGQYVIDELVYIN